jgi:hypothetical protein
MKADLAEFYSVQTLQGGQPADVDVDADAHIHGFCLSHLCV